MVLRKWVKFQLWVNHAFKNTRLITKMSLGVFDSVKEEVFWRNYFYRVSLIKQSAQLTALAAQQQQDGEDKGASVSPEDIVLTGQILI